MTNETKEQDRLEYLSEAITNVHPSGCTLKLNNWEVFRLAEAADDYHERIRLLHPQGRRSVEEIATVESSRAMRDRLRLACDKIISAQNANIAAEMA